MARRRRGLVGAAHPGADQVAVLAQQELHLHRARARAGGGTLQPGRHGGVALPRARRRDHRPPQPLGHAAPPGLDGQRPRPRHDAGGPDRRPAGTGAWVPAGAPGPAARQLVRLQPALHLHPGGDHPTGDGVRLSEYLRPRLFDPLGIGEVGWLAWPPGREQGFSGLFARTEDVAKLGQLYLRRGRWGETQLLPEGYVQLATSRQVGTPNQDNVDWRQGYGFQFWMARHGYRGDGAFGQFCVVLPEADAVVAITAGTEDMQAVLDNLWRHLLPGLDAGRTDDAAQQELDQRLDGLSLPALVAKPSPPRWQDWTGRPFPVAPGAEGAPAAPLTSIELRNGAHGLEVTVADPANALSFPVGSGDWLVSEPRDRHGDAVPVAASGGWLDDRTVRVDVIFLESPHRMDIACSLPGRTAEAAWRGVPLDGGRLQTLHRPR